LSSVLVANCISKQWVMFPGLPCRWWITNIPTFSAEIYMSSSKILEVALTQGLHQLSLNHCFHKSQDILNRNSLRVRSISIEDQRTWTHLLQY
jgi:hypothetical protein